MLAKLAWNGMKSKRKDYIVLLTGLVMAIAIFYMFQTLALNRDFTSENAMINSMQLVFNVGSFLLAAVTFFYILYTNTFLLSLRQKEYGLFMLLGAKKQYIKRLMFVENLLIGIIALIIGIAAGTALSEVTAVLITNQLDIALQGYHAFYLPSLLVTLLFFLLLFFVTAVWNHVRLSKVQVLDLVHAETKTDHPSFQPKKNIVMITAGILSLAAGWCSLVFMEQLREFGVFSAAIMTTLGTYLLFSSLLPVIVQAMKKKQSWNETGIQAFTLSQLTFRIHSLKKLLATAAMLIALGAGAISGGMAFKNNAEVVAENSGVYDAVVHSPTTAEEDVLAEITFTQSHEYRYKREGNYQYYLKEDLEEDRPQIQPSAGEVKRVTQELPEEKESLAQVKEDAASLPHEWSRFLSAATADYSMQSLIVSKDLYEDINAEEQVVFMGKSDDFLAYTDQWAKLDELREENRDASEEMAAAMSKYSMYESYNTIATGTVFMGFFLGIAFLAMMASCLMFKVLSGAARDIPRYDMLKKIGVPQKLLKQSVAKELFLIFLFPALLGMGHVLIGMNMFSFIVLEPYYRIWVSILLFVIIYFLYYLLTVALYRNVVLPKQK